LAYLRGSQGALLGRIKSTGELNKQDEQELASLTRAFIADGGFKMK